VILWRRFERLDNLALRKIPLLLLQETGVIFWLDLSCRILLGFYQTTYAYGHDLMVLVFGTFLLCKSFSYHIVMHRINRP
jgi:hypothetical protein